MAAKKSKSRFTDLVKFVPEDIEEAPVTRKNSNGIQTNRLDPVYEEKEVKKNIPIEPEVIEEIEPEFDEMPDVDDIPEIEMEMEEEYEIENEYEDFSDNYQDEIDAHNLAEDIEIDEEPEEEEVVVEEKIEKTKANKNVEVKEMDRPVQSFGQQAESKREFNSSIKNIDETIILGNTTIKGDIITDTGIQIYGAVLGNIESGGRVQLVGKVEGDITGKSVYVTNTTQTGNITAETEVHIKEGCTIEGDVKAEKVFLKGTVVGNIQADGQVDFESGSEIRGNVAAHSFNIKPGAKINGSISTN